MLGLAFLHPALLWALPLAAVPIIIHILNRRRFQKVPWAAMEFLLKAMKRNRKRLRMEQWLVLLLRVLAVLLLVSLVSRPQLGGGGLLGTRTHHVIVLDDSASMTQRSGSTNLFEKAQDRIKVLADDLAQRRNGDLFSIVRTSAGEPDMWSERVGPDFGRKAGQRLKELEVGDGAPSLGKAFAATVKRAQEVEDAARTEYYLVGDSRSWDWATADDKPRPALLAALGSLQKDREHVTVMTVGGQHANIAVVSVRLRDRLAMASVPVTLAVDVQNFGLDPTSPTTVSVEVDGQSRIVQDVPQLSPGERVTVPIAHTFHEAGAHHVVALLEPSEAYAIDDRRTLALQVRERSRVLLVDGQPDEDDGEVFFLQATLDVPESGIEAQVVSETGFDETNLDAFDLIWWCNVQAPTQPAAERLTQFVADGGGLVIACGSLIDAPRYNELLWRDGEGPLPLPIGDVDGDSDRPERTVLVQADHPLCDGVGEVLDLLLGNVMQVKRWLELIEPEAHDASVIARIRDADGPPLLVTRTYGGAGGEVAMLSITADRFWSNMPSTHLLLVMTHQLHRFAARRDDVSRQNLTTAGVYTKRARSRHLPRRRHAAFAGRRRCAHGHAAAPAPAESAAGDDNSEGETAGDSKPRDGADDAGAQEGDAAALVGRGADGRSARAGRLRDRTAASRRCAGATAAGAQRAGRRRTPGRFPRVRVHAHLPTDRARAGHVCTR